jgi:hypothetical protein
MGQVPITLQFLDEVGESFPVGVPVNVYDLSDQETGAGLTQVGGTVFVLLQVGQEYYAEIFSATQGPINTYNVQYNFIVTAPITTITIPNYRSPTLSPDGYAALQCSVLPNQDFPPAALTWGGNAYNIAYGIGNGIAGLDFETQQTLAANRLETCQGGMLDSWANDYIGAGIWVRGPQESDAAYYSRILLWLTAPMTTLYGIQELLQAFINAWVTATYLESLALDVSGALDEFGALDGNVLQNVYGVLPTINVFDWQSNSTLCSEISGFVQDTGTFVILFTFPSTYSAVNWFAGVSFAGVDTYAASQEYTIISAPTPQIAQLVNTIKGAGTQPLYVSNVTH